MSHLQEAGIERFVVRAPQNLAARRSQPPAREAGKRGRPPVRGRLVRPTIRQYRGRRLAATAPDREAAFVYQGRRLRAMWFDRLVVSGCPLVISCLVVYD